MTAAHYANEIDDLSRSPSSVKKTVMSKDQQNSATEVTPGKSQESRAEGTPILIYFTRDKTANDPSQQPGVASPQQPRKQQQLSQAQPLQPFHQQSHEITTLPTPVKMSKNVQKLAKLEKSVIKSMNNGKSSQQTPVLPDFGLSRASESTMVRNNTGPSDAEPMFKSSVKSEIKTVSSVTTKAQVDCCATIVKKNSGTSATMNNEGSKLMANLTVEEVGFVIRELSNIGIPLHCE